MESKVFKIVKIVGKADSSDEDFEKSLGELVSNLAREFQKTPISTANIRGIANKIIELANKKAQLK